MTKKQYITLATILAIASLPSLFLFSMRHFVLSLLIGEFSLLLVYVALGKKHIS